MKDEPDHEVLKDIFNVLGNSALMKKINELCPNWVQAHKVALFYEIKKEAWAEEDKAKELYFEQ